MRFRPACFFLSLLVFVSAAVAQDPPRRDPEAIAVIEKAVASMGGTAAAASVTDTIVTGTIAPASGSAVKGGGFTWKTSGSNFRYEVQSGTSSLVLVSGQDGAAVTRNGTSSALSPHMAQASPPLHLPGLILARVLDSKDYTVILVGKDEVNGVAATKIRISLDTDLISSLVTPQDWYFDMATGLPLRVENRLPDQRHPENYATAAEEFSDFRIVSGLLAPFRIKTYEEGKFLAEAAIAAVVFNSGVALTEFRNPVGGAR
jgi:hypothetical protein